jgi:hypothetical protein
LIGESTDVLFNLEEARNAAALQADREALEKRLAVRRKFYADSGQLQTDAARDEIEQIGLDIQLVSQKEAELRKQGPAAYYYRSTRRRAT